MSLFENIEERIRMQIAGETPEAYQAAKPFPHAILDHLITEPEAHLLAEAFPDQSWKHWRLHANKNTLKRDCGAVDAMPLIVAGVVEALNSAAVLEAIRTLTGIPDLAADVGLEGGGMHRIDKGGFLGIHRDFNLTPDKKMRRRVNLLVYLNACHGGDLELWEEYGYRPSRKAVTVTPWPGRAVIFNTDGPAWHGHPRPLQTPTRLSLASYYYTKAEADAERHLTIYTDAGK